MIHAHTTHKTTARSPLCPSDTAMTACAGSELVMSELAMSSRAESSRAGFGRAGVRSCFFFARSLLLLAAAAMAVLGHDVRAQKSAVGFTTNLDSVKGVQVGLLTSVAASKMSGLQFGGFANMSAAAISGMQLSGVSNIAMGVERGCCRGHRNQCFRTLFRPLGAELGLRTDHLAQHRPQPAQRLRLGQRLLHHQPLCPPLSRQPLLQLGTQQRPHVLGVGALCPGWVHDVGAPGRDRAACHQRHLCDNHRRHRHR